MPIPQELQKLIDRIRNNDPDPDLAEELLLQKDIDVEGVKALAEALKENHTITRLHLSASYIGAEGTKAIAEALKTNRTITTVDLSRNNIGTKGAKVLAEALKTNNTIAALLLSGNDIDAEGAEDLAKALETNKSIIHLDLSNNNVGDKGVKAITKALETNRTLGFLELSRNNIGPKGAKDIAFTLIKNDTLTDLHLKNNKISSEGGEYIAKVLEVNSTLIFLGISGNRIGSAIEKNIAKQTNQNIENVKFLIELLQSEDELTHDDYIQIDLRKSAIKSMESNSPEINKLLEKADKDFKKLLKTKIDGALPLPDPVLGIMLDHLTASDLLLSEQTYTENKTKLEAPQETKATKAPTKTTPPENKWEDKALKEKAAKLNKPPVRNIPSPTGRG